MLQGAHSAILSTFIKLTLVIKIFVLSIFEWPLKTDFTVVLKVHKVQCVYRSIGAYKVYFHIMSHQELSLVVYIFYNIVKGRP